jgi:hypothetical protein
MDFPQLHPLGTTDQGYQGPTVFDFIIKYKNNHKVNSTVFMIQTIETDLNKVFWAIVSTDWPLSSEYSSGQNNGVGAWKESH